MKLSSQSFLQFEQVGTFYALLIPMGLGSRPRHGGDMSAGFAAWDMVPSGNVLSLSGDFHL